MLYSILLLFGFSAFDMQAWTLLLVFLNTIFCFLTLLSGGSKTASAPQPNANKPNSVLGKASVQSQKQTAEKQ